MSGDARPLRIGLLGLGEAGSAIASDLVDRGVDVRAWDPRPVEAPRGVRLAGSAEEVADVDVVLSINSASVAVSAAQGMVPMIAPSVLYADLNSGSASLKRSVAEALAPTGALFVDVALMATVPGNGIRTPALVSGPGAERFVEVFSALDMPVESVGSEPGVAATHKLLRSVFMKGIAVTAVEALRAAEAAGCREWLWDDIAATLTAANEALLTRLVHGTELHAARRAHEMADASEVLRELGVSRQMCDAAGAALRELAAQRKEHGSEPAPTAPVRS